MGILDRVFGKHVKGGMFNQANQHWQVMKQALLAGNATTAQSALLEVVRLCQEAIAADPLKAGDAYVLLTNAILRAPQVYSTGDEELLMKYAAACIHTWLDFAPQRVADHFEEQLRDRHSLVSRSPRQPGESRYRGGGVYHRGVCLVVREDDNLTLRILDPPGCSFGGRDGCRHTKFGCRDALRDHQDRLG